MTNESLNIGDMVVWCNPLKTYVDEECCGVIVEVTTEADGEIVYNVDWFKHNRTSYRKEFLRKIS
jgi:Tfp pilus assembly protein PilZ